METLKLLIQEKKAYPQLAHEVVSEAADWLKTQLDTAAVKYHFVECEKEYYGYATVQIHALYKKASITLSMKIAEIKATPYLFADIRVSNETRRWLFPFFGEIKSDEGRALALNYIADYLLSVE